MNDIVIKLENISKTYTLYERNVIDRLKDAFIPGKNPRSRKFEALKNINLEIRKGEILGIIGRNGAGKSTLVNIISGITPPSTGTVFTKGIIVPLLDLGGGLNPAYTGKENIFYYCAMQGMHKNEIEKIYDDIVEFSELEDFINVPVKKYSRGMKARLAFALSINIDPDILILDEVLSVGDELFKRKCFLKMEEFFKSGKTILFISHSLPSIAEICNSVLLLHKGEIVITGPSNLVIPRYRKLLITSEHEKEKILQNINSLEKNPHKKQQIIRKNSRLTLENQLSPQLKKDADMEADDSFFIKGFVSKVQRKIIYKRINIKNLKLSDNEGNQVNHILPDRKFTLSFDLIFKDEIEKAQILTSLYTDKQKNIAGYWLPDKNSSIEKVKSGDTMSFQLEINNNLVPGIYGIKIIIRGILNDAIQEVACFFDVLIFKVLPVRHYKNCTGVIHFFSDSKIE